MLPMGTAVEIDAVFEVRPSFAPRAPPQRRRFVAELRRELIPA